MNRDQLEQHQIAIYFVAVIIAAVGGLLAGALATALGAGYSLLLEGALLLCFVAFVLTRRRRLLRAANTKPT